VLMGWMYVVDGKVGFNVRSQLDMYFKLQRNSYSSPRVLVRLQSSVLP
jgi:hypothetical protein